MRECLTARTVEWECAVIPPRPGVSDSTAHGQGVRSDRNLTLKLDDFAWEALQEESARQQVSVEELIAFALLYYLADADSGRIARRISRSPYHPDSGGGERSR
jgi:hypothetical protein